MRKLTNKEIKNNFDNIADAFYRKNGFSQLDWQMWSKDLTEVFKQKINKKGFEDIDDIRWRLSYSQGDGVAFYGGFKESLTGEEFQDYQQDSHLINSLAEQFDIDLKNKYIYFEIYKTVNNYNHYNSMAIEIDIPEGIEEFKTDLSNTLYYYELREAIEQVFNNEIVKEYLPSEDPENIESWNDLECIIELLLDITFEDLIYSLEQKIKKISKELESFGYNFLEDRQKEEIKYKLFEAYNIYIDNNKEYHFEVGDASWIK